MGFSDLDLFADFGTVRNGTALLRSSCHDGPMRHKNTKKERSKAIHATVRNEIATPRMARSARIAERKLDAARILEEPSVTMPGTVKKIIPSTRPSRPEEAQIGVHGADRRYRDFRIENALLDEHGDDVRLKKGAHVEVTVKTDEETSTAETDENR